MLYPAPVDRITDFFRQEIDIIFRQENRRDRRLILYFDRRTGGTGEAGMSFTLTQLSCSSCSPVYEDVRLSMKMYPPVLRS